MPEGVDGEDHKSIRWLVVEVPGKPIEHARRTILNIAASIEKYKIFREMRQCTYELWLSG